MDKNNNNNGDTSNFSSSTNNNNTSNSVSNTNNNNIATATATANIDRPIVAPLAVDEIDFSMFKSKSKKKSDKADAALIKGALSPSSAYEKRIITSRATDEEYYDTSHPNIGVALIFNHRQVKGEKERVGTEKDRDDMQKALSQFGFEVRVYNELTFEQISNVLKETAAEDHSENDCFVLSVMSHGNDGRVYARDMTYPVERLWNPFLGENCKSLINKPKIFFIQACRGQNLDKPVTYESSTFVPMSRLLPTEAPAQPVTYAIPNTADMLVMYSTFEKYYSFRNVENGSWFIQGLCAVLESSAERAEYDGEDIELIRMLTAVNRKVAYEYQSNTSKEELNQMKEMPNFMSTLTKTFYLKVKR